MNVRTLYLITYITIFLLVLVALTPLSQAQAEPNVSAQAAVMMDVESGRVLYEQNSQDVLRIASITKIMTAIVALEHGQMQDMVETSPNAFGVEGSSIYLRSGEKLTLEEMLYGLMLRSGNDAAVAIAEHIGGSLDAFVWLMNQKAEEIGMRQTHFRNPHGLDTHEDHYSSAYDMALLTRYALKNDMFSAIVSTKVKRANLEGEDWDRVWYNKNRLLDKYPFADGVKTGYTKRANRTLASSATKEGHRIVIITLNAPNDWQDHMNLYEYAFHQYKLVSFARKHSSLADQRLQEYGTFVYLNNFLYPLQENEQLHKRIFVDENIQKGLATSFPAGFVHYYLEDELIGRTPIALSEDEETIKVLNWSWHDRLRHIWQLMLSVAHG